MTYIRNGNTNVFKSLRNGVFWIGELPDGYYFIHELAVPQGYAGAPGDRWFAVKIDGETVKISDPLANAVIPQGF